MEHSQAAGARPEQKKRGNEEDFIMKKTKKFWAVLAAAGLLAASFAGCGSNASASAGSSSGSADGSSASDSGEKKVIKAVTSGTLAPYFYVMMTTS